MNTVSSTPGFFCSTDTRNAKVSWPFDSFSWRRSVSPLPVISLFFFFSFIAVCNAAATYLMCGVRLYFISCVHALRVCKSSIPPCGVAGITFFLLLVSFQGMITNKRPASAAYERKKKNAVSVHCFRFQTSVLLQPHLLFFLFYLASTDAALQRPTSLVKSTVTITITHC